MNQQRLLIIGCLCVILGGYGLVRWGFGGLRLLPVPCNAPSREQLRLLADLPAGTPYDPDHARARLLAELRDSRRSAVQAWLAARGLLRNDTFPGISGGMDEKGYYWPVSLAQCQAPPDAQARETTAVQIEFVFSPDGNGWLSDITITER